MNAKRIAVTMGDPAGVGPELCLRLLAEDRTYTAALKTGTVPLVFGEASLLKHLAARLDLPQPERVVSLAEWNRDPQAIDCPAVVDFNSLKFADVQPGVVSAANGLASYRYLERAIQAALAGEINALCTAPIHKEALHAAGIPHPGHTEILAELTGADRVVMMLTADEITCSLVTAHVGLHEVPGLLTPARILDTIELTAATLAKLRGRPPRLTVCGLNPHAGEHGLFGQGEEERLIQPAIDAARAKGHQIVGPLPPDTAFLPDRRAATDGYICMYHDQGLIPLKMLAFDTGVNVTLGLPIVRTSVDHGTAFDIAWQGRASSSSLFAAYELAQRLAAMH